MTSHLTRLIQHRDPACTSGFSAVIQELPDWLDDGDRKITHMQLRCWDCLTVVEVNAYTRATDDPETDDYVPPPGHVPGLSAYATTLQLPASKPVEKHGPIHVHPEHLSSWGHEPYEWLATDIDGNVLGAIMRYRTRREAVRFRWALIGGEADGENCQTIAGAAKAIRVAAGLGATETTEAESRNSTRRPSLTTT